ncbi:MAG: circadian clock KaiB family protein [Spirochaetia bacterium]|nr:circadian clock KaiB family protein [Spirochaetia bacterium]
MNTEEYEALVSSESTASNYVLRLYVAGMSTTSKRAIENVKNVCDEHLGGRYDLHVVDLYQKPTLAEGEQIIAVPTLVKKLPEPLRKIIGDMSDKDKLLIGLDLKKVGDT